MLSKRVGRVGFSPTLAVNDLARRLRAEGRNVLDFSAGQPDFHTPDPIKEAGRRAIDENQTRYTATAGIPELREAIAESLKRDRGLSYSPGQIIVSPGGKASLYFAFMALLDPGDEVLVPNPYWTSYPEQVKVCDAEPVFVPCLEQDGFKLTAEALERAVTPRTKALILNYPSNPTGACYSREELEPLAEVCVRRNIWVIADEIYANLLYDGLTFTSIAGIDSSIADRTIVVDGMSKTYAMTGWRIGYAAGPQEVIQAMGKLQSHSTSNATSISQWASVDGLKMPADVLAPRVREFEERRNVLVAGLREIPGVTCAMPEGAFYVFPNVSGCFRGDVRCSDDLARYLLEQAEVAAVPGEAFGSTEHIRLSYAASMDVVRKGLQRITEALAKLTG